MHESEEQETPDVSTEPQRQALDEMSRQLVEKLNQMVKEQRERVESFAATQHSLSALPEQPLQAELPEAPAIPLPPELPKPARKKKKRRGAPALPQQPAEARLPQDFEQPPTQKPLWQKGRPAWLDKATGEGDGEKAQENGCGTVPTIVLIVIIVLIIRACT